MEKFDLLFLIIIGLFIIYDIMMNRRFLLKKNMIIAGALSYVFLLIFLIAFYYHNVIVMIVSLGLGLIPSIYFHYGKYRNQPDSKLISFLTPVLVYILMIYAVIKIVT